MTDDKTREALIAELADALDWTWEAEPPHVPSAHDVLVDVVDRLATRFYVTERSADPSAAAVEAAAAEEVLPFLQRSNYVPDWPEDEQTLFRSDKHLNFALRDEALEALRARKAARAALTAARAVTEGGASPT